MKKKNAIMLADTRVALVGTVLLQLQKTNPGLFDEAIIYFEEPISEKDRSLMSQIMPCRFIPYTPPFPQSMMERPRFQRFSKLMFCRYEMFRLLSKYAVIMWIDTDVVIQGGLQELLRDTEGFGFSILCEDPENKSAKNVDYMRTNFITPFHNTK